MTSSAENLSHNDVILSAPDVRNNEEDRIKMTLLDQELWSKFNKLVNEMIVTKMGRRMFPVIKVSITGLEPNSMYSVTLDFIAADNNRWKYVNGAWMPGGKPEPHTSSCAYVHTDSPNFGSHWMKQPVHFSSVKLTNKASRNPQQIMLNSLHKYKPCIHVFKVGGAERQKRLATFTFQETHFIAVTAYQNEDVTTLKIRHNPFAKAFLDVKESRSNCDQFFESSTAPQQEYATINNWITPNLDSVQEKAVSVNVNSSNQPFATLPMDVANSVNIATSYGRDRQSAANIQRYSPYSAHSAVYQTDYSLAQYQQLHETGYQNVVHTLSEPLYANDFNHLAMHEWTCNEGSAELADPDTFRPICDQLYSNDLLYSCNSTAPPQNDELPSSCISSNPHQYENIYYKNSYNFNAQDLPYPCEFNTVTQDEQTSSYISQHQYLAATTQSSSITPLISNAMISSSYDVPAPAAVNVNKQANLPSHCSEIELSQAWTPIAPL